MAFDLIQSRHQISSTETITVSTIISNFGNMSRSISSITHNMVSMTTEHTIVPASVHCELTRSQKFDPDALPAVP